MIEFNSIQQASEYPINDRLSTVENTEDFWNYCGTLNCLSQRNLIHQIAQVNFDTFFVVFVQCS